MNNVVDDEVSIRAKSVHESIQVTEQVSDESIQVTEKDSDESKSKKSDDLVGEIIQLGSNKYFVIDIFENEIMELGDEIDLNFKKFNNFEAIDGEAPQDHHFYKCYCHFMCCCVCTTCNVDREWRILERELSKRSSKRVSFFVRAYKERKELMRVAVIVTDRDSSLCHSLFLFDVKFPTDYRCRPPAIFHHSYGRALTSDLTFRFDCFEILDVFVQIEGIVLNHKDSSKSLVWLGQSMLNMLKRPLTGFEDLVKGHFRKNGGMILKMFMDVMNVEDEKERKMFLKMYIAFEENQAYCEHLVLDNRLREELKRLTLQEILNIATTKNCSKQWTPVANSKLLRQLLQT